MATFGTSNRVSVAIAPETTPGVLEPNFYDNSVVQRITGESLQSGITYTNSEELRSDRQMPDLVQTDLSVSGDLQIELSAGSFNPLLESVMGSTFTTADAAYVASGTTVDADNTFNSTAAFTSLPVQGQWIKVSGRTVTDNNGYFQVSKTVAPTSSVITLEGNPLTIDATSEDTTIEESAMLRMGTTDKSFTIVRTHEDVSPVVYLTFVGMRVSSMSLSFSVGSIVTGSFAFMGLSATTGTTAPTGTPANQTAASTTDVLNAVGNISNVWLDNAISASFFSDLGIDLDAGLREQKAIDNLGSVGIGQGRFGVTGSISAFFENLDLYTKYLNATSFAIAVGVEDPSGNGYIFSMGNCKFDTLTINASGSDQDIMADGSYTATYDADTGSMLQIDRFGVA